MRAKSKKLAPVKTDQTLDKTRGRDATMARLKETGLQAFSEFGFDGTTTKILAARSGVNEALIIRYFESKLGLLKAIIVDQVKEAASGATAYPAGKNSSEEIENFLTFHLNETLLHLDFLRITISAVASNESVRKLIEENLDAGPLAIESVLGERLKALQRGGKLRKGVKPERVVRMVTTYISGVKLALVALPKVNKGDIIEDLRFFASELSSSLSREN